MSDREAPHGNGYVKIYRKMLTSAVFQSDNLLQVWIWCLLRANWHDTSCIFEGKQLCLKRGQFITGRYSGSKECKMKPGTFYDQLRKLAEFGNIVMKSDNKKTLIIIVNYEGYQSDQQQANNSPTPSQHQANTDKEVKNRNIQEDKIAPLPAVTVLEHWNSEAKRLGLSPILTLSDKRLKAVTARLSEKEFDLALCFKQIEESSFCRGENDREWKVDFDWLFGSTTNYLKLLEGKYSGKRGTGKRHYNLDTSKYPTLQGKNVDAGLVRQGDGVLGGGETGKLLASDARGVVRSDG